MVLQETKKSIMSDKLVKSVVGLTNVEWCALPVIGCSGGILIAWNPVSIKKNDVWMGIFSISLWLEDVYSGVD